MTLFVLVAFTSQTLVTQTHIHVGEQLAANVTAPSLKGSLAKQQLPSKSPTDDSANCPICQGLAHAGSYVTPSPAAVVFLTGSSLGVEIARELIAVAQRHSHGWQSRAPPLV